MREGPAPGNSSAQSGPPCHTPTDNYSGPLSPCPSEKHRSWRPPATSDTLSIMIVTHTQNAQGQRRLYLGGKSSLECWIEPDEDGTHWQFKALDAVTGNDLTDDERRACMTHYLLGLARELGIPPLELAHMPSRHWPPRTPATHSTAVASPCRDRRP
jgi:hypothetical protein